LNASSNSSVDILAMVGVLSDVGFGLFGGGRFGFGLGFGGRFLG